MDTSACGTESVKRTFLGSIIEIKNVSVNPDRVGNDRVVGPHEPGFLQSDNPYRSGGLIDMMTNKIYFKYILLLELHPHRREGVTHGGREIRLR